MVRAHTKQTKQEQTIEYYELKEHGELHGLHVLYYFVTVVHKHNFYKNDHQCSSFIYLQICALKKFELNCSRT